jgi:hypothetical protein
VSWPYLAASCSQKNLQKLLFDMNEKVIVVMPPQQSGTRRDERTPLLQRVPVEEERRVYYGNQMVRVRRDHS